MFKKFLPTEGRFFDLFNASADLIVKGAEEFRAMLGVLEHLELRARAIKRIEHDADTVTHDTVALLHKTFITPLDREDIHELISRMDDILDYIEAASERLYLYNLKSLPPEAIQLADISVKAAKIIKLIVVELEDLKNQKDIIGHCVEINRLENEADHVLRSGLAKLFRDEPDTRQLIMLKEVYELLETVTDRCEDVANIIEGIVLEYS